MKINISVLSLTIVISGIFLVSCQQQLTKVSDSVIAFDKVEIYKTPNDDRLYEGLLLPNKLQVVLVSDPTIDSSAASLAVGVGSAQDPDSQPGLAHYLEHMLFLGTKKYPTPNSFMDFTKSNGGMTNAFTGFDKTNFFFSINSSKFEEALDRYSDYFKSPLLDPQFADKERHAVAAEWTKNKDQDVWIFNYIQGLTANPKNPRARFSVGNLETLADKKDSKLQAELTHFYDRYYSANNMCLTLIGKQSISELKILAEKYFSGIPNKNIPVPKVTEMGLGKEQLGKIISYRSNQDVKKLLVQFPIKNNKADWKAKPNQLVSRILGTEEKNGLSDQLHRAGFINNLYSSSASDLYGPDGIFQIEIALTDLGLKHRDDVIAAIFAYVSKVKKEGIDEFYFDELKAIKEKDFINGGKPDPVKSAIGLTTNQFDYPLQNVINAGFVYDHFDRKAISNVLQQLNPVNSRIWYIGPNELGEIDVPFSSGKYSIRNISKNEFTVWEELGKEYSFDLPAKNTFFSKDSAEIVENTYIKPHQVISKKGIEIFLAQPEFYREDKGVLDIELNVLFAQDSAKNVVLSYLLNDIFIIKNRSLIAKANQASLRVNMAVGATGSQFINIAGYTIKHEELLSQILQSFSNLNIEQNDLDNCLKNYSEALKNSDKNQVYQQALGHVNRLLSNSPWSNDELLKAANSISLGDIIAYKQNIKDNVLVRVYAFGNYDENKISNFARIIADNLPGTRLPGERLIPQFATPKARKKLVIKDKVTMSDNAVVDVYMSDKKSVDEKAAINVLNVLYGNEYFRQLRTNEQLGYIAYSYPATTNDYAGLGMVLQSSSTSVSDIKLRMDKFRMDFLSYLKSINPSDIENIKASQTANVLKKPTNFYEESKRYDEDFWYANFNFDSRDKYLKSLSEVNKASLVDLYQRILVNKKNNMNILIELNGNK